MSASHKNIWRDESGAALIEFTAAVLTFFLSLFGVIEFANVFYQWNAATKAVQLGARLAAVSDPVATELTTLTGMEGGALPGDAMTNFDYTCTAANANCAGDGGARSIDALNALVYGRDSSGLPNTACDNTPTSSRHIGMCNIFSRIEAVNVSVRYQYTGLGYAGRPGGPVPTITVSLTGATPLTYDFIIIGGLAGLSSMQLPSFATTVTGEDLNVSGS